MRNWIASELRSKALHRDKRKLYSLQYKMTNGCCQTLTLTFPRSIKRARNKSDASERVLRLLREHLARGGGRCTRIAAPDISDGRISHARLVCNTSGVTQIRPYAVTQNPANETGQLTAILTRALKS